ncbi:MAG: MBL fold metallo-hydrolase [Myxococcota bacterium]
MYAIHLIDTDLWRITLPNPDVRRLPGARPVNVYLVTHDAPALINAGHPTQHQALGDALREIGTSPSDIERIVCTSWQPDHLGGAQAFPRADTFVFSPDMLQPTRYDSWLDTLRRAMRELFARVEHLPGSEDTRDDLDAYLASFVPPSTEDLRFIPLRGGHVVRAGDFELEVLSAPGPDPGHIVLWDAQHARLFSGALTRDGLPEVIHSVQGYLVAMERALELEPKVLLPSYGLLDPHGTFTLRRSLRFLHNFLGNAPGALAQGPTLLEFVERDMGYIPRDRVRFAATLMAYRAFLDELVRTHNIDAAGTGVSRRYGIEPDDPRLA